MYPRPQFITLSLTLVLLVPGSEVSGQAKPAPSWPSRQVPSLLLYEGGTAQVVETFSLIQQANSGIPAAQHELGYRYLFGRGLPADTVKGAEWILRAAANRMALAQFNAGILYTHALGVEWDPFKAYSWFKRAAALQLPAAQFILGIFYTDGLVIPRDYAKAFQLVREAHDQGYSHAAELLEEFRHRGFDTLAATKPPRSSPADTASSSLIMLHFDDVADPEVGDTVLVLEFTREVSPSVGDSVSAGVLLTDSVRQSLVGALSRQAERGIPEAHMILGRMYEKGIGAERDVVRAAVHYLRANRLDSPRAPAALAKLIRTDEFRRKLMERAQEKEEDARYVWASLSAIEFDEVIGWEQALRFLREQSEGQHPHSHSCIELGFWYASGRNVEQDPSRAIVLWNRADSLGVGEGLTRIALAEIILRHPGEIERMRYLRKEAEEGSILAQAGLGFCLERGIGTKRSKPEAATWYRKAAQRGSLAAYNGLKGMYDELRPDEEEFNIE